MKHNITFEIIDSIYEKNLTIPNYRSHSEQVLKNIPIKIPRPNIIMPPTGNDRYVIPVRVFLIVNLIVLYPIGCKFGVIRTVTFPFNSFVCPLTEQHC